MFRPPLVGAGEDARQAGRAAERRLVREAQNGSGEALEALFKLHWPAAFRSAYYIVHDAAAAEDIAQEAFLAARPGARSLRRPAPLLSLDQPDRGQPRDRLRPRAGAPARGGRGAGRPGGGAGARPAISDDLLGALAALAPEQRAVVVLRYLLDWTPGEIARALGIPRGTVNSRLRRALDRLAGALEEGT